MQINSIIRASSQRWNRKFDLNMHTSFFFLRFSLRAFSQRLCHETNHSHVHYCFVWQLLCISAHSKGRQSRAKWNYISDRGRTHKNTSCFSYDLSYFPSSNSILRMSQSETPKHKAVINWAVVRSANTFTQVANEICLITRKLFIFYWYLL